MPRRLLPILLLVASLVAAGAAAAKRSRERLSPGKGAIAGSVRSLAGEPLVNAGVRILGGPMLLAARTDARGSFLLNDLVPGTYDLLAEKAGHASSFRGRVEVAANTTTPLHFTLEWANPAVGALEVFAQTGKREPLPGATVELLRGGTVLTRGSTDAFGSAEFEGVTPDVYEVVVTRPGFRGTRSRSFQVPPGRLTTLSFRLKPDRSQFGALAGVVRDVDGNPIRGASVTIVSGYSPGSSGTGANGSFQIRRLVPGSDYSVEIRARDFATQVVPNVAVRARETFQLTITLVPDVETRGSLAGQIKDLSDQPVPFATVKISVGPELGLATQAGVDGRYLFTDLIPSTAYGITAEQAGYSPAGRTGITVTAGATTQQDLVLLRQTSPPGSLLGSVKDRTTGQPISGARVEIIQGPSTGLAAVTDSTGNYLLGGVIPDIGYALRFSKQDYDSTTVSSLAVSSGSATRADAELASRLGGTGTISGVIREFGGGALGNVRVTLFKGPSSPLQTFTAADGTYRFENIVSGSGYAVRAQAVGYVTQEKNKIVVQNGQVVGVNFALRRDEQNGVITGRVYDLTLKPIPNARIRVTGGPGFPPDVFTDADGNYAMPAVPPGTYTLEASANGFRPDVRGSINVTRGNTTTVNFQLLR